MSCLQCLFCKIVNGREPADIIYSDEDVIIFKDIRPKAVYHYLVCPKKHIVNARELTPQHIPLGKILYVILVCEKCSAKCFKIKEQICDAYSRIKKVPNLIWKG